MGATLKIADDGAVTLELPGGDGKTHAYALRAAPPGLDARAVYLLRIDSGSEHRVAIDRQGKVRCACKDALYRGRHRRELCKHGRAVKALLSLIERLS